MPSGAASLDTPYTISLLSEYTHTLDALPIDLSRNFGDLRELDAVLSSSVHSITAKIQNLTTMIEEGTATKQDRLWLLTEIAEEAGRLKLGGEDKIRVACQAADNLKGHSNHLRTLSEHIPGFDASVLDRKTVYPHVSERSYMPATTMETGRRRRGVLGSIMTNPDPSPAKRKRVARDDDLDVGSSRTPKKVANGEGNSRARNNARAKKTERAASPSESLVSVTSHLPPQVGHSTSARGGNASNSRSANATTSAANKRARAGANNHNRNPTPLNNETFPAPHDQHNANGSRRGAAADSFNVPPSASHPSLPLPYQNGNGVGHVPNGYDVHGIPQNIAGGQDWNIPHAQQLEGPGMPVARSASIHSTATSLPVIAANVVESTDAGDADGDGDDRTYCFCDGVSYGEMIACDDEQCEREWFHLTCIGLETPPDGRWFCDACKSKKTAKRSVRGGKRRTGGNRATAKS
ncbi:hypothetical protein GALMADRAFT_54043 [Galerina marginata CBS 339.88]|uniref:Chromatin modification-related protein n=1 Tax=Galerina marginata (strain CBS 339.88) TaxID=685588 RepID=A0A067TQT3_GALM3|nr:hypothetical protein GALMADRAFT_54043 [Galerina marginata CBS 339.88]